MVRGPSCLRGTLARHRLPRSLLQAGNTHRTSLAHHVLSFYSPLLYLSLGINVSSGTYVFGSPGAASFSRRYGSGSGSGSFYHPAKIVRKTLISTVL
jgi:hypothetical protein